MKRRMCAAERERLEAIARPVVLRYVNRALEAEGARQSAQSMTRLVLEVLRRGCMVQASPSGDTLRLTRSQQWLIDLEWVWRQVARELGPWARHVVVLRLSRAAKTEASSFGRIAHDVTEMSRQLGRGDDLIMPEAEALYRAALPLMVRLLRERGISGELPVSDSVVSERTTYRPYGEDLSSQRGLIAAGRRLHRFAHRRRPTRVTDLHDVSHGARV